MYTRMDIQAAASVANPLLLWGVSLDMAGLVGLFNVCLAGYRLPASIAANDAKSQCAHCLGLLMWSLHLSQTRGEG